MKKVFFRSIDGIQLCGIWHHPDKTTQKAIILAHGITVDKDEDGMFIKMSEQLRTAGFAVFRFDFRGHGESNGKSTDMTIKSQLLDLEASLQLVLKAGFTEIALHGASFAGGATTIFTSSHLNFIRCLCLWNPCLNYEHCFLKPVTPWMKNQIVRVNQELKEKGWASIGSSKTPYGQSLFNEMSQFYPFKELFKITIPTIIIQGDQDKYVPYEDAIQYVKNLPGIAELKIIEGAHHGFHEEPYSSEAIKTVIQFFQKYL